MTDAEHDSIADAGKEVTVAIWWLAAAESRLESNEHARQEYQRIRTARKLLQKASRSLYAKEHWGDSHKEAP